MSYRYIHLPQHLKHPSSNDSFYPVVFENVIFDCFNMRVNPSLFDRMIYFLNRLYMTEKEQDLRKLKIFLLLSTQLLLEDTKSFNIWDLQLSVKLLRYSIANDKFLNKHFTVS